MSSDREKKRLVLRLVS